VEKLQDLLTKMFENFSEVELERPLAVKLSDMTELYVDYAIIINKVCDSGDIQLAMATR
jgi:hypothetical protein